MPSGFQFGATCYPTALAAAQAYVSTLPPVVVAPQATCPHWASYLAAGSTDSPIVMVTYTKIPTAACTVIPLSSWNYLPVPCSTLDPFNLSVEDGALVAGAVLTVWLGAYAARAIRSVLKDRDND